MSTSPSWFDQEKFSRLVKKKVGAKNSPPTEPLPTPEGAAASQLASSEPSGLLDVDKPKLETEKGETTPPASDVTKIDTESESELAPILDNKAEPIRAPVEPTTPKVVPLPTGPRSVPTLLPRRTAPLPALKSLFQYEVPASKPLAPPLETVPAPSAPAPSFEAPKTNAFNDDTPLISKSFKPEDFGMPAEIIKEESVSPQASPVSDDLSAAWEKIAELNEDVLRANRERDEALDEVSELRTQLSESSQASPGYAPLPSHGDELLDMTRERDEALEEASNLREELRQARESASTAGDLSAQAEEITLLTEERDQSRSEYATLREDYENLKQEQIKLKGESGEGRAALEQELGKLRQDSEKHLQEGEKLRQEIEKHKQDADKHRQEADKHKQEGESLRKQVEDKDREINAVKNSSLGMDDSVNTLKKDIAGIKEQLTQAKEEASVAQRGLTLSQKALQETRDALREATEGSSQTKSNFENLKKECSTLVQQNMMLQAQYDQLARDLSAAKAKLTRG